MESYRTQHVGGGVSYGGRLLDTLGKLEIYEWRADYQKSRGANYSLREFHDAFVKQGGIPINLIRRLMVPGDQDGVL